MDQERIRREEEAAAKLKETIARRKEEAARKKEEEQRLRQQREEEEKILAQQLAEERKRKREEEIKRRKEEQEKEEELKQQKLAEEKARKEEEQRALIQKAKEDAARKKEEEERLREMEIAAAEEERQRKLELIKQHKEAAKEENARKREEEERLKAIQLAAQEEDRLRKIEQIKLHKAKFSNPSLSSSDLINNNNEQKNEGENDDQSLDPLALKQKQMAENIARAREEAKRLKEEKEREEQAAKQAKEEEEKALLLRQKAEIMRRKEENARKLKEEKEKEEKRKLEEMEAQKAAEISLKIKIEQNKLEVQRRKEAEEELKRQQISSQLEEAEERNKQFQENLRKRREDTGKDKKLSVEEQQLAEYEKQQLEREELRKAQLQQQKLLIEKAKEESRRKKEEEERVKRELEEEEKRKIEKIKEERERKRREEIERVKEEKQRQEQEKAQRALEIKEEEEKRKREKAEKRQKYLEELKATAEAAEAKLQRENEEKKKQLEEEQKIALQRHLDDVRKRQDDEKDLEDEQRKILELERVKKFEEEQRKRKEDLERITIEENERKRIAQERIKKLGGDVDSKVVNRCGLFSQFGEEPGLEIWVLGDQTISKIAKMKHGLRGLIGESHGTFNVSRAYVILHTSFGSGRFNYKLHSWIGSQTPVDMIDQSEERLKELQIGLAYENLEVKREKEREESAEFRGYFEGEIEYVSPVVLKATEGPNFVEKKLYLIKGRNNIHVKRVAPSPSSINEGDVYILEDSAGIYQWNGKKSNKMERGKALDFGVQLRIERNARVKVIVIDQGNSQCDHDNKKFWASLRLDRDQSNPSKFIIPDQFIPLITNYNDRFTLKKNNNKNKNNKEENNKENNNNNNKEGEEEEEREERVGWTPYGLDVNDDQIGKADEGENDLLFEQSFVSHWSSFLFSPIENNDQENNNNDQNNDNNKEEEIKEEEKEIGEKGIDYSLLSNEKACLVIDTITDLFIWIGSQSSPITRKKAEEKANQLKNNKQKTDQEITSITIVRSKCEPYLFKEKFYTSSGQPIIWADSFSNFDFSDQSMNSKIANLKEEEINIHQMKNPDQYLIASEDKRMPLPYLEIGSEFKIEIFLILSHHSFPICSFSHSPPSSLLSSIEKAKPKIDISIFDNPEKGKGNSLDEFDEKKRKEELKLIEDAKKEMERKRDGGGEIEIGSFFSHHCYLVLLSINLGLNHHGNPHSREVIYYWQGRHSSREDRGTSAMIAGDMAKQYRLVQVERVSEGKEPLSFLSLFSPSLSIHFAQRNFSLPPINNSDENSEKNIIENNNENNNNNNNEEEEKEKISKRIRWKGDHLYSIRGRGANSNFAYAIETENYSPLSLNSNDVFLIIADHLIQSHRLIYIWKGKGSKENQLFSARSIADLYVCAYSKLSAAIHLSVKEINEGEENSAENSDWFSFVFPSYSGKFPVEYSTNSILQSQSKDLSTFKLFACSNSIGVFRVQLIESDQIAQEDLNSRDCFILDGEEEIFVWEGQNANEKCKKMTWQTAEKYSAFHSNDTPLKERPIRKEVDGEESSSFRGFFHTWDSVLSAISRDPYLAKLRLLTSSQSSSPQ